MFFSLTRWVFLLAFILSYAPAFADSDCGNIQSYREAMTCIAQRSPDIQQSKLRIEVASSQVDQTKLFANPELQSNSYLGDENKSGQFYTETQLYIPIPLGGVRSARGKVAMAQKESAVANAQSVREKILIESAEAFYRLRQIGVEVELAEEAIRRFENIISAFRRRGKLNPEQKVSLTIFRYAVQEEKQKVSQGLADQKALENSLSLLIGQKVEFNKNILPATIQKWPTISDKNFENAAELKIANAQAAEAKANLELSQASAWPEFKLGPSYERMPDQNGSQGLLGVAVVMEFPVFDRNQGGKRAAEFSRQISVIEAEKRAMSTSQGFESLLVQYKLITDALITGPTQAELEKGHQDFDTQFNRGLVPYGLIIEAHRQLHETVVTRHVQELRALDLMWRLYQMNGKLSPEVL